MNSIETSFTFCGKQLSSNKTMRIPHFLILKLSTLDHHGLNRYFVSWGYGSYRVPL